MTNLPITERRVLPKLGLRRDDQVGYKRLREAGMLDYDETDQEWARIEQEYEDKYGQQAEVESKIEDHGSEV